MTDQEAYKRRLDIATEGNQSNEEEDRNLRQVEVPTALDWGEPVRSNYSDWTDSVQVNSDCPATIILAG
jgi:hypothetical protein